MPHAGQAWPCSVVSLCCAAPAFSVSPSHQGTAVAWAGSCSPGEGIASSAEGPLWSSAAGMWSLLPSGPMVAELRLDDEQVRGGSDAAVAAGFMSTMQHVMLSHPAPHSTLSRCLLESACVLPTAQPPCVAECIQSVSNSLEGQALRYIENIITHNGSNTLQGSTVHSNATIVRRLQDMP